MKTIIAALAATVALSAVAVAPASAQPYRHGWHHHHHPHKVCFIRHHRRICTWR